jgi:hypothetical protein
MAAPVHETTPPDVYAFGTYWSSRFLGVDSEMSAAARKIDRYRVVLENINLIAGRLGLKLGTIPE